MTATQRSRYGATIARIVAEDYHVDIKTAAYWTRRHARAISEAFRMGDTPVQAADRIGREEMASKVIREQGETGWNR